MVKTMDHVSLYSINSPYYLTEQLARSQSNRRGIINIPTAVICSGWTTNIAVCSNFPQAT